MAKINSVCLAGRVGNIDVRENKQGKFIVMSLAVSDYKRDPNTNQWLEDTHWYEVVYFAKPPRDSNQKDPAGRFLMHVEKGDELTVQGRLKTSEWQSSEGQKRSKVQIVIDNEHWQVSKKMPKMPAGAKVEDQIPF